MQETIENLVKEALKMKNEGKYKSAVQIILRVLIEYPNYNKNNGLTFLLSGCYFELGEYHESIYFANKVIMNKPEKEEAHLIMYLSYHNINLDNLAFDVLFNYLNNYRAVLFIDTLKELLKGLKKGYSTSHRKKIVFYSKKNEIIDNG